MVIEITDGDAVRLFGSDDFTRLSVTLSGTSTSAARAALEQIGEPVDDSHVFVSPEVLSSLAGARAADPQWQTAFAAMLDYARSRGWTDATGRVRVHVEPGVSA
jgi:hypothetical protein